MEGANLRRTESRSNDITIRALLLDEVELPSPRGTYPLTTFLRLSHSIALWFRRFRDDPTRPTRKRLEARHVFRKRRPRHEEHLISRIIGQSPRGDQSHWSIWTLNAPGATTSSLITLNRHPLNTLWLEKLLNDVA